MRKAAVQSLIVVGLTQAALSQSQVVYTLELGGDNHAELWEADQLPPFTCGVTDNSTVIVAGEDLTWAVRVTASGTTQSGIQSAEIIGAANLVFDLQLEKLGPDGVTWEDVPGFGAAPMSCGTLMPGEAGARDCVPTGAGFWSSINDGDGDGTRYGGQGEDPWANAAFAISLWWGDHTSPPDPLPDPLRRLRDPVSPTETSGPNMDYGWYPTTTGRGGIPITGARAGEPNTSVVVADGALLGFGVGYKNMNNTYLPGVGMDNTLGGFDSGFGADVPLFEGQISTVGLEAGTYRLRLVPSADGTNVIHGWVNPYSPDPDYGGHGSFAVQADAVLPVQTAGIQFETTQPEPVITMHGVFYNKSYYDGNKAAIDSGSIAGANNDDSDAVDWSKQALNAGEGTATFKNWTGYNKGLNGLVYQIDHVDPINLPDVSDFAFTNIGKGGTGPNVVATPSAWALWDPGGGSMMLFITFPDADPSLSYTQPQAANVVLNAWLQVDVGTGFGLPKPEQHFWGNVAGDVGDDPAGPPGSCILVNPTDEILIRTHSCPWPRVAISNPYDINKDGLVSPTDQIYVRTHSTTPLNCVKRIAR